VQVATQHPKAVGQRARVGVIEGLLLDGIALRAADVTPGHKELTALVVPDLANSHLPIRYSAAMPAGVTAHETAVELFVKLTLSDGFL
jgi:hypothetical protein